jgi:hypothetical protein
MHLERLRPRRSWLWPMLTGTVVVAVVAAGAAAAIETDTVESFWRGLWWSISLITTVGFIGAPPTTTAGAALSVVLMVIGFLLMAMVSASLAALFVREDEEPREARETRSEDAILDAISRLEARLAAIETRLAEAEAAPPHGAEGSGPAGP